MIPLLGCEVRWDSPASRAAAASRPQTAGISPHTIVRVRDLANIVTVIGEAVPSLKNKGRSWVGLCPFHKEKSPSFHVNQERGFFHCFGCKESGSVIDFVMKHEGATFPEAVRSLAERFGIPVEEERPQDRGEVDRQKRLRDDLHGANAAAAVYFEQCLREHPDRAYALDELERRGLVPGSDATADEALRAFRIGYAPSGWDGLANYLRQQGISPLSGEATGLLVPRSAGAGHYDRFRHRLMFAVVDLQGRVVAFSGRALPPMPGDEPKEKPAKYINSPESPVYTKGNQLFGLFQARAGIRAASSAVLVEGNFDVVSLHARGIDHVVAPLGTAFTEDQAKLLKRFTGSVTFLFDGDFAGKKAARASRDPARQAGLSVKVATLPDGQDPDELVRTRGAAALDDLLRRAKGMLEYLLETELDATFNALNAFEKAERVDRVVKLLAEEDDPLVRSMAKAYADNLAARLDLARTSPDALATLEQKVKRALAEERRQIADQAAGDPKRARIPTRAPGAAHRQKIVGAFVDAPELLDDLSLEPVVGLLEGNSALTLLSLRQNLKLNHEGRFGIQVPEFLAGVPMELRGWLSARLAAPEHADTAAARAEVLEQGHALRGILTSQEGMATSRRMDGGDLDREMAIAEEMRARVQERHAKGRG